MRKLKRKKTTSKTSLKRESTKIVHDIFDKAVEDRENARKLKRIKSEIADGKEEYPDGVDSNVVRGDRLITKIKRKRKRIKRYPQKKCMHVEHGMQCGNLSVGKGTLCKKHGGDPVIKENLLTNVESQLPAIRASAKFDPTTHPINYISFSRHGASPVEIAAEFEISIDTLKGWAEKYESFNVAYEVGAAMHESWWLQQGKNNLNARSFNTSLFKYLTMNKLGYSDKIEQKNMNMNVHGVLVIPDKVTSEEWEADEVIDVDS